MTTGTESPVQEELEISDEAELDDPIAPETYAISSFGIDFDVEGLVRRLRKTEVYVPHFQRSYVWSMRSASQFVESLLLGLPVPGVFLAKDGDSGKFLIIDGQQRLKSLQFFYDGFFNPSELDTKRQVFSLTGVQKQFEGRTYQMLDEEDKRRLDNAVIHSTIIKQEAPKEDEDTSLYYIFGRLNSGGTRLTSQEIRSALYHGPLDDLIETLNNFPAWREIFGKKNKRLKDQELILRFLALLSMADKYERPMEEFINKFCKKHQNGPTSLLSESRSIFEETISFIHRHLGAKAFRPVRSINAAVLDSVMVGVARRLRKGPIKHPEKAAEVLTKLLANEKYVGSTSKATADESNVRVRLTECTEAFDALT